MPIRKFPLLFHEETVPPVTKPSAKHVENAAWKRGIPWTESLGIQVKSHVGVAREWLDIHGWLVEVTSDSVAALGSVLSSFQYYRHAEPTPAPAIRVRILHHPGPPCEAVLGLRDATPCFDSETDDVQQLLARMNVRLRYFLAGDREWADLDPHGMAVVNPVAGLACVILPEKTDPHPWAAGYLFSMALSAVFRERGRFFMHAAGVRLGGRGIVIPGSSGSGKTTLCVALVKSGSGFLGDDRLLLEEHEGESRIRAFWEPVNVTEATRGFFPEIPKPDEGSISFRGKSSFRIDQAYPGCLADSCEPEVMLFPRIVTAGGNRLIPLSGTQALVRLLPHSLAVLDPETARKHFNALSRLVRRCRCHELEVSQDLESVRDVLSELLTDKGP